jgi:cytochrome b
VDLYERHRSSHGGKRLHNYIGRVVALTVILMAAWSVWCLASPWRVGRTPLNPQQRYVARLVKELKAGNPSFIADVNRALACTGEGERRLDREIRGQRIVAIRKWCMQ